VPPGAVNVFGVPVKVAGEWQLMAARFLSVNNKANLALATKHTCISCHNPDIKAVGPSYRDVAAKYKDDPAARATLIAQIEKGGTGKWGVVPMPPLGAKVPPADREVLIDWVLGYRWDAILAE
jgi:cytochrome c